MDSQNTLVVPSDRKMAVLGVSDVVIVDSPDGVLVAHRSRDQQVKQIVGQLNKLNQQGHTESSVAYRPWGRYEIIDRRAACGDGNTYQVKRLIVNPGASLSLQVHEHRAEHWIVVSGVARVTNGDRTFEVTENESTYIPSGQVHSLENPGSAVLEMIEVQSGSYVGEDDIVRLDDKYGRG
jgi:mannose-1-phosphate guanylyltransferase